MAPRASLVVREGANGQRTSSPTEKSPTQGRIFRSGGFEANCCHALLPTRQVTATVPSFEEVALQLVDSGDPAALQTFLLTRLQVLGPQDKAQVRTACSIVLYCGRVSLSTPGNSQTSNRRCVTANDRCLTNVVQPSLQRQHMYRNPCHVIDRPIALKHPVASWPHGKPEYAVGLVNNMPGSDCRRRWWRHG